MSGINNAAKTGPVPRPMSEDDRIPGDARDGWPTAPAHALDGARRLAYLREAFEDARWLRHGRQAAEASTGAARDFKRKLRRLYLPWAYSVKDVLRSRTDGTSPLVTSLKSETARKIIKSAVALAVAVLVGWGPTQRLMQTTSVEAIVNAPLITLRSPIDGELSPGPNLLAVGASLAPGTPILKVIDRRADRARLDELRRGVGLLYRRRPVCRGRSIGRPSWS
jgi:hypothetical protein